MKHLRFIFTFILIVCFPILISLLAQSDVQAGTSFDSSGWGYRKSFTIQGSPDGAQTNYQMCVRVYRSGGADGIETMGLFIAGKIYVGTKCAADYGDIRFTKSDCTTLLDYWIEDSDSNDATVWVELDSIPAEPDSATFYVYYGNSSAITVSNGDNTFPFFDHFDGILTGKWQGDISSCSVASSKVTLTSDTTVWHTLRGKTIFSGDIAIRANISMPAITVAEVGLCDTGLDDGVMVGRDATGSGWKSFKTGVDSVWSTQAFANGYHTCDIYRI